MVAIGHLVVYLVVPTRQTLTQAPQTTQNQSRATNASIAVISSRAIEGIYLPIFVNVQNERKKVCELRISNTFKATAVDVGSVTSTGAVAIGINGRPFRIANTGAQTIYFNPSITATSTNGFPLAAGTTFPEKMTTTTLSVIAGSSSPTYAVIYFDL